MHIGTSHMQEVTSLKILGFLFTSYFLWRGHCKSIFSKVSRKLGILQRFGAFMDMKTRSYLYKAYIKPDIEYCLPDWGNHNTAQATSFNTFKACKKDHNKTHNCKSMQC